MKIIVWSLLAVAVLGGTAIAWRRRWLRRADALPDSLIKPITADSYRFRGQNDALRARADRRKAEADEMRKKAALHAAGQQKPAEVRKFRREA